MAFCFCTRAHTQVDDNYVARRKAISHGEHHHHIGVDYNVGRYAPKQSLGKVIVNVDNSEKVSGNGAENAIFPPFKNIYSNRCLQEFEDGQILVEFEPIRYELRDIKIDKFRTQVIRNLTKLGETKLINNAEYSNLVEAVIGYSHNQVLYWGTYEGVARGLPTVVYETNRAPVDLANGWGLKIVTNQVEVSVIYCEH